MFVTPPYGRRFHCKSGPRWASRSAPARATPVLGRGDRHWGRQFAYPNESLPTPMREPGAGRPASSSAGAPPPPCYAHKGPELDNTHRTHRLDSALVCAGVLRNSGRCVRGRGWVFRNICLVGAVLSGLGLLSWETCKRSGVFKGKSRTWGGCGGCFASEVEFSKGNRHFQSVITLAKCGIAVKASPI